MEIQEKRKYVFEEQQKKIHKTLTHGIKGMCLFLSEQPKEAEKVFETALELNPKQSLAHFHRGVSLLQIGNSKSSGVISCIPQKNPNDPEALYNMGIALAELGKHQEALEMYEKYWRYIRRIFRRLSTREMLFSLWEIIKEQCVRMTKPCRTMSEMRLLITTKRVR